MNTRTENLNYVNDI